jgi:hypothetical protein
MFTRPIPEQGLHQIPELAVPRNSGNRQLRFRASARLRLHLLAELGFPNSARSRVRDFTGYRLPRIANSLLLKTYFENFVKLSVSRVTGFPEFPNSRLLFPRGHRVGRRRNQWDVPFAASSHSSTSFIVPCWNFSSAYNRRCGFLHR